MKKLLGTLIFLILIAATIWGGATWFLGQQTEKIIKQQIEKSNETNAGLAKVNLVEYKNTSFTTSRAVTQITTGIPFVDDILNDANIITEIKHGPIILSDSGVKFAASKWSSHIDLDTLDDDVASFITELFGDKNPLLSATVIGFNEQADYTLKIPALSQEGEANFAIDGLTITGSQSLQNNTGNAKVTIGEMHLQDPTLEVIVPSVTADLNINGFIGSQMLGSSKISAPNVKLKTATAGDIRFDLDADSSTQQANDEITGNLKLLASNVTESSNTIKQINFDIDYQGLSAAGLNEFSNLDTKLNNLQKQLMWNMEATKNPEGQEKMMALLEQIQQVTKEMVQVFFDKVLIATKSQINQTVEIAGDKGKSTLDAEFIYTGDKDQQTMDVDKLMLGDISSLLNVIAGTVAANIDKAMLPEQLNMMLKMISMQNITKDEADKFTLNASLTDSKVTLNGETMSFEDFVAKFSPTPASSQEGEVNSSLALPKDIEQRIQEEGLTDEIMQDIEESDDVSPEVLQQVKELKYLMDSVDAVPPELPADETTEQQ